MKINKEKLTKTAKIIGGLILLPIILAIFTFDRIILIALPHVKGQTFGSVLNDLKLFRVILYRVITVCALYGVYSLLKWVF